MVDYIDTLSYVNLSLNYLEEVYQIIVIFLIYSWIQLANISLIIFPSILIWEIHLYFSFFVEPLCGLSIGLTVA